MNKLLSSLTKLCFFTILGISVSCSSVKTNTKEVLTKEMSIMLDSWHNAAAKSNYKGYFSKMTDDAIFIGTDAKELWEKEAFEIFAKPYFDEGKAWSFTSLERHIYFSEDKTIAWFDELLDTQMELCRGSGVAVKTSKGWKIKHYVLSMTIPNETVKDIVPIKRPLEQDLKSHLKH